MDRPVAVLFLVGIILAATLASQSARTDASAGRSGKDVYESTCGGCHDTGKAAAPRLGAREWKTKRLSNGANGLVRSALNGKGVMPPKGSCMECLDDEIGRAVGYLAGFGGHAKTVR